MTRITAAVTKVGRVEFAVVSVRGTAVATTAEAERTIRGLGPYFPGRPIVLAANVGRRVRYVGRPDLTRFLSQLEPSRLPWKTYTFRD